MADVHRGPCRECGRPMVDQREWMRNPKIRPGRVKSAGYGRCAACYIRGKRHGTLPQVQITARYPVTCDQCGPVGEAGWRSEANQIRLEHLAKHGAAPAGTVLDDRELASLRRMVGVA